MPGPPGLDVSILLSAFLHFHAFDMRDTKAQTRMLICAVSFGRPLLAYAAMSTKSSREIQEKANKKRDVRYDVNNS